jgi:hypothetical protein
MTTKKLSLAKDVWETLHEENVNHATEKVGKFTYLSWTWAWQFLMEYYPQAQYVIHDDIVFPDGSMEVRVSISIEKQGEKVERIMWLPVMNHKNQAIINPNAFQVNTARMRCLVKCIAMLGLGCYIYAGEDLPASEKEAFEKPLSEDQRSEINKLLQETNANLDAFLAHYEVDSVKSMTQAVYDQAIKVLQTKKAQQNSKPQAPSEDVVDAITHGNEPDTYEEEANHENH